jgi:DNA-binding NarL/FixJ family response regulator
VPALPFLFPWWEVHVLVMVVEDHPMVCRAVAQSLSQLKSGIDTIVEESLKDAIGTLQAGSAPDLIVLDLNLPDARGLAALDRLSEVFPVQQIVAFSGEEDPELIRFAYEREARGYILKSTPDTDDAFRRVLDGKRVFPPMSECVERGPIKLSEREYLILRFLAKSQSGGSLKEVKRELGLSDAQARKALESVRIKLNAKTQLQALAKARVLGLMRD